MLGADKPGGAPNIEVRLGAIYALERIAGQSDTDYRPIIETLCAYMRETLGAATTVEEWLAEQGEDAAAWAADGSAGLNPRVRGAKLRAWGAALRKRAAARGAANPARPDIRAALAVLMRRPAARSRLEDWATAAPPPLDLPEPPEPMTEAAAAERRSAIEAYKAMLVEPSAALDAPDPWRPDLARAETQGAAWSGADLRRWDLREARLEGADLSGARLEGAALSEAHLEGADLRRARLEGADLWEARLEGADLWAARLEGAVLWDARLNSAEAMSARFARSLIASAEFSGCHSLTVVQLASALGDAATILPDHIAERPAHWARERLDPNAADADWRRWLAADRPTDADWRDRAPPAPDDGGDN